MVSWKNLEDDDRWIFADFKAFFQHSAGVTEETHANLKPG
jgi:hypothetical protein